MQFLAQCVLYYLLLRVCIDFYNGHLCRYTSIADDVAWSCAVFKEVGRCENETKAGIEQCSAAKTRVPAYKNEREC